MIPRSSTCGICLAISEISSRKELKLASAFFLTSFALTGVKILHLEYAVALLTMMGNGARIKSIPRTVWDLRLQKTVFLL